MKKHLAYGVVTAMVIILLGIGLTAIFGYSQYDAAGNQIGTVNWTYAGIWIIITATAAALAAYALSWISSANKHERQLEQERKEMLKLASVTDIGNRRQA